MNYGAVSTETEKNHRHRVVGLLQVVARAIRDIDQPILPKHAFTRPVWNENKKILNWLWSASIELPWLLCRWEQHCALLS